MWPIVAVVVAAFVIGLVLGWFGLLWLQTNDSETVKAEADDYREPPVDIASPAVAVAIRRMDGTALPTRNVWDDRKGSPIPYEELSPMFLDQFLLRYFAELMPYSLYWLESIVKTGSPWEDFVRTNPWAKEMPLLFEQLTGYKLTELQLNYAIAEYVRRLQRVDA